MKSEKAAPATATEAVMAIREEDSLEAVRARGEPSVGAILQSAVERGVDAETLERLVALHERMQAGRAQGALAAALARFQSTCPEVPRNRVAEIVSKNSGSKFTYNYAPLETITATIAEPLAQNGLSYTWDCRIDSGLVHCKCTVHHIDGGTHTASFSAPVDPGASMSPMQAHAAGLTFGKRQTLMSALGLSTCDPDTDGRLLVHTEKVSDAQAHTIREWIALVEPDVQRFLTFIGAKTVDDIPADKFDLAVDALRKKAEKKGVKL